MHPFLRSKNWDTRAAAGAAIEAIVANMPSWDPKAHRTKSSAADDDHGEMAAVEGRSLFLAWLCLKWVLQNGPCSNLRTFSSGECSPTASCCSIQRAR